MIDSAILLSIIKLVLSGITAFLAIALWSKTRDGAWMCLVTGAVTRYAGLVYEMLVQFGFVVNTGIVFFGIPLITLLFTAIPSLFFILAFILMLHRTR